MSSNIINDSFIGDKTKIYIQWSIEYIYRGEPLSTDS